MADTLVERVTGQAAAADVNIELHLLMPLTSLLDPHNPTPAEIAGYGPIPAGTAHDLLRSSRGRRWWRRLFTAPADGPIIGGDRFRRRFDGPLATLIRLRDRTCRDPTATHRSATSTTCIAASTADPPPWPTAAGCAPAATTSAKCPAGPPPSPTTADTTTRTLSPSPPPPVTPTPAAHPNRPR